MRPDRPCYPAYTAGPCMRPWQERALGCLTLAVAACWVLANAAIRGVRDVARPR